MKEVSGNSSESQEGSVQEGHKKSSSSFENDSLNSSDADAIFGDCKGQSNLEPLIFSMDYNAKLPFKLITKRNLKRFLVTWMQDELHCHQMQSNGFLTKSR